MNLNHSCCKDCVPPKRNSGCHGKCPEYIEEKEAKDKFLADRRKQINGELEAYAVIKRSMDRAARQKHIKRRRDR